MMGTCGPIIGLSGDSVPTKILLNGEVIDCTVNYSLQWNNYQWIEQTHWLIKESERRWKITYI